MADYDMIVLGSGNAGTAAATEATKAGWKVALVESRDVGGTCALRGCVPKKVLVAAGEALEAIAGAPVHHIEVDPPRLDWAALIERERSFVEGVPDKFEAGLRERGIEVIHGRARFVSRNEVEVNGDRISARKMVVAVGSKPRSLPFAGAEHLITSDDFLRMRDRPARAVFVGAGVIAFEFAHLLARAGTRVTMLEVADRPLPPFDADAVDRLVAHGRELGIELRTGVSVQAVERGNDGYVVRFREAGSASALETDRVIHGAGRVAALDDLELDAAGVAVDDGKPRLDAHLRSRTNPDVSFAGDARGPGPQLSPVATYEGRLVARNAIHMGASHPRTPDYGSVPACVFTVPALATVGQTERQAREGGASIEVHETDMSGWISGRTYGEKVAYSKILVDEGTRRLLGAHLVGHGAPEVIHAFALAMRHGLGADALEEMVYAYPTFHADIRNQL
ncbi:MAG: dihydrolipoyl dehydrogenase family protein [Myxococcota bacterium]